MGRTATAHEIGTNGSAGWDRVTPQHPCLHCERSDERCAVSKDGKSAICYRVGGAGAQEKRDKGGTIYYSYKLDGNALADGHAGNGQAIKPAGKAPGLADPARLDEVYRALLDHNGLALSPANRVDLERRGFPDGEADRLCYRSMPARRRDEIAHELAGRFGRDVLLHVPGFFINDRQSLSITCLPGLLIPVRDVRGRIGALIIRPDEKLDDGSKFRWVSSKTRGGPSPGAPPHVPLGIKGPARMVRLTEGQLKADLATALSGMPTVGAPGVGNWRCCVPVLKELGAETVRLAFDADWRRKPKDVARPLLECGRALVDAGFALELELWPEADGKGIDDLLAAGKTPEVLAGEEALAALAEVAKLAGINGAAAAMPPTNGRPDHHQVDEPDFPVNEAPDDPHRLARAVLAEFRHRDGPALAWYREAFHVWDGAAYRPDTAFMNRLVALVKGEIDRQNRLALQAHHDQAQLEAIGPTPGRPTKPPVATKVTRRLIADVVQALASLACIDQEAEAPFWVRSRPGDPSPAALMPAANGLVDLDAGDRPALLPHTPRLFTTYALPYRYQPDAPPPAAWLKFLNDLWGGDPASVRELQKWFGYALTPEIDQQKILLLIGSPGSGRSTIKDVLSAVVGRRNVASTSAVALADRFGLEPLVGKTLAILGDARTGDTHDAAVMMDRLLRISGGDPVEVNRKGRPILHDVLMRTRLVIVSNEMPNFRDASKAIVRRYLPLCTPRSFEGLEDHKLPRKLMEELPGLLNWAIAGRAMLAQDGRFITPPSAEDLIDDARALASPVAEFVAEECSLGPDQDVTVDEIWGRWKVWAEKCGHQAGHRHLFGRNLRAATGYKITSARPRGNDARFRMYKGIGLRAAPPAF